MNSYTHRTSQADTSAHPRGTTIPAEVTQAPAKVDTTLRFQADEIDGLVVAMRSLREATFLFDAEEEARKRATFIGNVGRIAVSSDGS